MPKFVNLECPVCKSTKCCGLLPTENRDNYRLVCLRESCGLNSISLNMAMEKYATSSTKSDWRDDLGWRPKSEWHGINQRRPRGKSQKSDGTSFRESQQQRQTLQHLKASYEISRESVASGNTKSLGILVMAEAKRHLVQATGSFQVLLEVPEVMKNFS